MNSVAGPIGVEAKDSAQECERACAVAFAGKESPVIDDMGRRAVLAYDATQLHPGKQVTSGRIQPDCNLAGGPIERVGKPVRRVSIDPSVEIDERRVAECTRWRSGTTLTDIDASPSATGTGASADALLSAFEAAMT